PFRHRLRRFDESPDGYAELRAALHHTVQGLDHRRVIGLPDHAQRLRQVVDADEDDIHTFDDGDLLDILHALLAFDLHDDDGLVGVGEIPLLVGCAVTGGTNVAADAAAAEIGRAHV